LGGSRRSFFCWASRRFREIQSLLRLQQLLTQSPQLLFYGLQARIHLGIGAHAVTLGSDPYDLDRSQATTTATGSAGKGVATH